MTGAGPPLAPGLYFVATPIGNARDITLRALDVLATADVLAAEDTRTLRRLMDIHGLEIGGRPLIAYHEHNGPAVRPRLLAMIAGGRSVAYASEAGSPLVADPGYPLAREAIEAGLTVVALPGPSALIAALTVSGLATDRILFAGFPPAARGARMRFFEELRDCPATLVFYESPKRVHAMLEDLCTCLGQDRAAAVARELTKRFEEVQRGTLGELAARLTGPMRGEIVVIVDRDRRAPSAERLEAELTEAMRTMRLSEAAAEVAERLGLPRRQVYQAALELDRRQ